MKRQQLENAAFAVSSFFFLAAPSVEADIRKSFTKTNCSYLSNHLKSMVTDGLKAKAT